MSAPTDTPTMGDAVVIVLRDGDRVLAIRRAAEVSRGGWWTPPTGRIEAGETAAEAAVREAREELGLVVRAERELWRCLTDDRRWRLHWWLVRCIGPLQVTPEPNEVAEWRWVDAPTMLALRPGFADHRPLFEQIWPQLLATDGG